MVMEGRGFSDLLRNNSEEIFLKTMMENPIGITAPSMEMLGFKNTTQSFRGDSEELFHSWLTNGEVPGHGSIVAHRTREASGRRRYAAMQSSQMATIPQEPNNIPLHGTNKMQLEFTNANSFGSIQMAEMSNQMHSLMSPSNSSTSFNTPQIAKPDKVSSVVCMLKGTLERKKLNNRGDKEVMEGSSYGMLGSHEAVPNLRNDQGLDSHVAGSLTSFHMVSPMKVTSSGNLESVEKSLEPSMESFPTLANQTQMVAASREPSQSESSTVAPTLSTGFEACDGPAHSGHTIYNGVISSRLVGNGPSDHKLKVKDYWDRTFENRFNDARKKASLVGMGSISSAASVDRADPTKKRRVERSRKMVKAKERNSTPPLPSDMQEVLKRFETLEKEVRSLKLNFSFMNRMAKAKERNSTPLLPSDMQAVLKRFETLEKEVQPFKLYLSLMNRKDSEQTKQIEELQKQNDELVNEKKRLLEEIERVISDSGKM